MSHTNNTQDTTELEDVLFCGVDCGVQGDPADGYGTCTCGNEERRNQIKNLIKDSLPEKQPPMKSGEPTRDSADIDKMIWSKKRGFNEALETIKTNLEAKGLL